MMLLNMVLQDSGLNELSSAGNGDSHDSSSNGDSKATAQQAILFEVIFQKNVDKSNSVGKQFCRRFCNIFCL